MNDSIKLVNAEFTLEIGGKEFKVRKANVEKAILYQAKVKELLDNKEPQADLKVISYCTWLVLKDVDPSITEDWVRSNLPGDIQPLEMLGILGFMSQQKVDSGRKIQDSLAKVGVEAENKETTSQ